MPGELAGADRQVADEADDERLLGRKVEHPLVVLDPRAGLDDDGAGHGPGSREGEVILGQHRAIEQLVLAGGPRDTLRAGRVVEMGVGVDDGQGRPPAA